VEGPLKLTIGRRRFGEGHTLSSVGQAFTVGPNVRQIAFFKGKPKFRADDATEFHACVGSPIEMVSVVVSAHASVGDFHGWESFAGLGFPSGLSMRL